MSWKKEFDKLCILTKDGKCKYWNPEAFGYKKDDTEAPLDKFFPEEVKKFIEKLINKKAFYVSCSQYIDYRDIEETDKLKDYLKAKMAEDIGMQLLKEGKIEFNEYDQLDSKVLVAKLCFIKINDIELTEHD